MGKTNIFHIQESILFANGFIRDEDLDFQDENLKHEFFTKEINDSLKIEITYTYQLVDGNQKLVYTTVELDICDNRSLIPITKLSSLLTLILILKGND
jgi:hypothetical protein